ncbi:MAG: MarR family winged helix-turn-helix transcriptional regulator [Microthrixaceae bacterium]
MNTLDDSSMLVLLLGRLERLNESMVAGTCSRHGISPGELRVLAMLRHGAGAEGTRPADIGQWVVQSTGGLAATVGRLEKAGRIERRMDPDDRRARRVLLTEDGRHFYDTVLSELVQQYAGIVDHIDVGESLAAVRTLIDAFEQAEGRLLSSGWDPTDTLAGDRP